MSSIPMEIRAGSINHWFGKIDMEIK